MNSSAANNKFGLAVVSYQVAGCVLLRIQSIKWFRTGLKSCCPCFPFSPRSVSPTAARYLLERRCVSRLLRASRRGTAKYVEIPEWRKGRTVTPGSFTSATTSAAHLIANSKNVRSAGKIFSRAFKCYKVLWVVHFQHNVELLTTMKRRQGANHKCLLYPSDRNSPCCKNCKFKKAGTRCQEAISATCKGTSSCTGELPLLVKLSQCIGHCQLTFLPLPR